MSRFITLPEALLGARVIDVIDDAGRTSGVSRLSGVSRATAELSMTGVRGVRKANGAGTLRESQAQTYHVIQ